MDLNGGRPPIPLIEEPRRPPWMLIIILIALAVVVLWVISNFHIRFDDAEDIPPVAEAGVEVVEREEMVPLPAPESDPGAAPDAPVRLPIEAPRWARTPQPEYPAPRAGMPMTARVTISCVVQSQGRLDDCVIVSEDPPGYGFGASALSAARQARLAEDARPGARITYTTRFIPPA
jgi:TonB family protein